MLAAPAARPRFWGADTSESLILRCPARGLEGRGGRAVSDARKEQRYGVSFEAPPFGLRTSG
ncbi:hypothetical protein GFL84_35090 [Rhizobium leguminosarum bv. viciae]|nr:hypothetical protein [Rhizobium leguminosarum bv. viciae]NKM05726.1 hypothetical protein [Rhizobium leguminosarum bv. viciae]NKM62972.1 hypothetical protein [Rhizobium leguminosarum bv. viciae]NKM82419.1 hypothetical protein [Rhizobium leguminosarum bv. viciae]